MKRFRAISLLVLINAVIFPQSTVACTCAFYPFLSNNTRVTNVPISGSMYAIRVMSHADFIDLEYRDEPVPTSMEIQIFRSFGSDYAGDTATITASPTSICGGSITRYPVNSEWLIRLGIDADTQTGGVGLCTQAIEIIDGKVNGFIRYKNCNYKDIPCRDPEGVNLEELTLDEFDLVQEAFYQGLLSGVYACERPEALACRHRYPTYQLGSKLLSIPRVDMSSTLSSYSASVEALFSKSESCEEGMFKLNDIQFINID